MRVRFLRRCGAYFPGADPNLDADEALRLIALGVCELFDKPAPKPKPEPTPPEVVEPPAVADEPEESSEQPQPTRRGRGK